MRGTLAGERGPQVDDRFIPAHAGNTPVGLLIDFADPVHPRACGEHDEAYIAGTREDGSSPRMRGTHRHGLGPAVAARFIPAHAGNTLLPTY